MCELFGLIGIEKIQVNAALRRFFSHSDLHLHGWGMAVFYGAAASLEKEPVKAITSSYLHYRLENPLLAANMMAHIRLASCGNISYQNCHPFIKHDISGTIWTLAHNGTIFNPEATHTLSPNTSLNDYKDVQEGQTDSERILYFLVDYLNSHISENGGSLSLARRISLVEEVVTALSVGNKLNLLIWDGERFYVHTNYADTLYQRFLPESESVMISTKPLDDEEWSNVPFLRLLVYEKGKLIYEGEPRSSEYVEEIKNQEYKDLDYSHL